MRHDTWEFIEKIKEIAGRNGFTFSEKQIGESVGATFRIWIDQPRLEIIVTARHCTVRNEITGATKFDKRVEGWNDECLAHIVEQIKAYRTGEM